MSEREPEQTAPESADFDRGRDAERLAEIEAQLAAVEAELAENDRSGERDR